MKKLLLLFALLPTLVYAQNDRENWFSSRAIRAFGQSLTPNGMFGVPRYPTASLPTCDALNTGAVAYDTTTNTMKVCNGTAWVAIGDSPPIVDTTAIVKGSSDATKLLRFEVDGFTAATTRVATFPNANITVAGLETANVFTSASNQFIVGSGGVVIGYSGSSLTMGGAVAGAQFANFDENAMLRFSTGFSIGGRTSQTPDTFVVGMHATANNMLHVENADAGFDYAVPLQTNPTLVVASANQSTQERVGLRHIQTQPALEDLATTASSRRPMKLTGGSAVASAATITPTGDVFHVTGTTNIDTLTIMGAGTRLTLIFDGILTVGDASGNIKLSAGFTTSADDTLTLVSDGTSWYEVSRSAN